MSSCTWHLLLMKTINHQTKTSIGFWCMQRLNLMSLIQLSGTLLVELNGTHFKFIYWWWIKIHLYFFFNKKKKLKSWNIYKQINHIKIYLNQIFATWGQVLAMLSMKDSWGRLAQAGLFFFTCIAFAWQWHILILILILTQRKFSPISHCKV